MLKQYLDVLDWSLDWGWDKQHGGILSFVDSEGRTPEPIEWDVKMWWPHAEAMNATLLAYYLTKENKYWEWFNKIYSWSINHFHDTKYGEWFGYLHRDGSVTLDCKGNMWKGPYHVPRAYIKCYSLLQKMCNEI